jgi:NitT/TauT family transport system substrate-binding protein
MKWKLRWTAPLAVLLTFLLILSACSTTNNKSTSANKGGGSSDSPKPQKLEKWVHGIFTAKGNTGFQLMGKEKGYYEELGIDFQVMEFESDTTMIKALIAGEIDSREANVTTTLSANAEGADLRLVAGTLLRLDQVLYTKKDIKSIEDLKGKVIGTSGSGSLPEVLVNAMLNKKSIGFDKVTWVNVGGNAARFKALVAGKIDAGVSSGEFLKEAEKMDNVHAIAHLGESLPRYINNAFTVTGNTVKTRGEALTKVLQAESKGMRYAIDHRDETIKLTAKLTKLDPSDPTLALAFDQNVNEKLLSPDFTLNPDDVQWMYELNKQLGTIKKDINVKDYIDLSFVKKVNQDLGEYKWPSK